MKTSLLMYLLALRSSRATLVQMGLLLGMTLAAVANHVGVAPKMAELMRAYPDLLSMLPDDPSLSRYDMLNRLSLGLLGLQILLGMSLLFLGVRRWYRYVDERVHGDAGSADDHEYQPDKRLSGSGGDCCHHG